MGSNYIADLARQNINILGIEFEPSDKWVWVTFEFQWRDPRSHSARWTKSTARFYRTVADLKEADIANAVIDRVKVARGELEGWEDERR